MPRFIKWLDEVSQEDGIIVGQKGANLGEILSIGVAVPCGFCVTIEAYKTFINTTRLDEKISDIVLKTKSKDIEQIKEKTAQIREQFLLEKIPFEIFREINYEYQKFCERLNFDNVSVSVRSSATMEDLPNASFAGQYDTYLNVSGLDDIVEKIKMCWASLWTEQSFIYILDHGLNHIEAFMSVVIQQMIDSEVSGVLFTANPISGNPFEIVIDSSWGLGETIVSGAVTPDRFVIDEENLTFKEKLIAEKKILFVNTNNKKDGIVETDVPVDKRNLPSLVDSKIIELCKLGILIKQHYKKQQDIEWALKKGKYFILQTRPITKLPNYFPVSSGKEEDKKRVWSLAYGQIPFSPFGRSFDFLKKDIYCDEIKKLTRKRFIFHRREINGYIYTNKEIPVNKTIISRPLRLWSLICQWYIGRKMCSNWQKSIIPNFEIKISEILNSLEEEKSLEGLVASITQIVKFNINFHKESVHYDFYCDFFPALLGKLCKILIPYYKVEYTMLIQGLNNKSLEKDRRLIQLANMVKRDAALYAIFTQEKIEDIVSQLIKCEEGKKVLSYTDKFLKKEFTYILARSNPKDPGCEEDLLILMSIIKEYINVPDSHNLISKFNKKIKERERLTQEILNRLSSSFFDTIFPVRQIIFSDILRLAQKYYPLKEDTNHYLYMGTWSIKEALLFLGRHLVASGRLNEVQDIFLFSFYEIQRIPVIVKENPCHFINLARERKREFEKQKKLVPPAVISFSNNEEGDDKYSADNGYITGLAGSKGVVTGIARLIYSHEDFKKLKKGDIIVCLTTRPFWTPLFGIAAGLVTDKGGVLSHGANLAREYGIPAVIGTGVATKIIKDGEKINVDGTKGLVYLVKKE